MIDILYEDDSIVVCVKPVGILSQADGQEDMPLLLQRQLGGEIFPLHRLDRNVGGVMVFARTARSAAVLSEEIRCGGFVKRYLAVVGGIPDPAEGEMKDILFKDSRKNKSFVVARPRKGTKEARLDYQVLDTSVSELGNIALVLIRLHTGRTHQIRVQFASRKMPLTGDGKYGSRDKSCGIALWSHWITFRHPVDGREMSFLSYPDSQVSPWRRFIYFTRPQAKNGKAQSSAE